MNNAYQQIEVLRETYQVTNYQNKKTNKNGTSNECITLKKLIKKPQGMNGN